METDRNSRFEIDVFTVDLLCIRIWDSRPRAPSRICIRVDVYTCIYIYIYIIARDNDNNNNDNSINNNGPPLAGRGGRVPQLIFIHIHQLFRILYICIHYFD